MADSIFSSFTGSAGGDFVNYSLGTKFTLDVDGTVTHARWYAVTGESGVHVVRLWQGTTLLADENVIASGPGWVTYQFPTPVSVTAGPEYTIHVSTGTDTNRAYANQSSLHASAISSGNINVAVGAGVYADETTITRPTNSYQNSGYFRDIIFEPGGVIVTTKTAASQDAAVAGTPVRGAQTIASKVAATNEAAIAGTTTAGPITVPPVTVASQNAAIVGTFIRGAQTIAGVVAASGEAAVSGNVVSGALTIAAKTAATSEAAVLGSILRGAVTVPAVTAATREAAVIGTPARGAVPSVTAGTQNAAIVGTVITQGDGTLVYGIAAASAAAAVPGSIILGPLTIQGLVAATAEAAVYGDGGGNPWFRQLYPLPEAYFEAEESPTLISHIIT